MATAGKKTAQGLGTGPELGNTGADRGKVAGGPELWRKLSPQHPCACGHPRWKHNMAAVPLGLCRFGRPKTRCACKMFTPTGLLSAGSSHPPTDPPCRCGHVFADHTGAEPRPCAFGTLQGRRCPCHAYAADSSSAGSSSPAPVHIPEQFSNERAVCGAAITVAVAFTREALKATCPACRKWEDDYIAGSSSPAPKQTHCASRHQQLQLACLLPTGHAGQHSAFPDGESIVWNDLPAASPSPSLSPLERELLEALRKIAYEPFGASDASADEVLDAVTACARAAIAKAEGSR